jgi:hypothetical protein
MDANLRLITIYAIRQHEPSPIPNDFIIKNRSIPVGMWSNMLAAARFLDTWARILPGARVSCECFFCQVGVCLRLDDTSCRGVRLTAVCLSMIKCKNNLLQLNCLRRKIKANRTSNRKFFKISQITAAYIANTR